MQRCEYLPTCGFFGKYGESLDLVCRGFRAAYCEGPHLSDCARLKFRLNQGAPPDDDMLPSGSMMPYALRTPGAIARMPGNF